MPAENSRILFAANTNLYDAKVVMASEPPRSPLKTLSHLELPYLNRSWWEVDSDDGLLHAQFTNVLQAVRFERDWTNYFYLCRDGANSTSKRVRIDSELDLWGILFSASLEQKHFIDKASGLPQKHKDYLYDYFLEHDHDDMEFWPFCDELHEISVGDEEKFLAALAELEAGLRGGDVPDKSRRIFKWLHLLYILPASLAGIAVVWFIKRK